MSLTVWKSRFIILSFSFLACIPMLCAPARGEMIAAGATDRVATPSGDAAEVDDLDALIASARAGVTEDPSKTTALIRLGELLVKKGAFDEAISLFDKALKINPRAHDAKTGKGAALARKGNLKEAEQLLKEALRLNPNPVRTHYELGLVYQKLGDLERAMAEFKEGIRKHEQGR